MRPSDVTRIRLGLDSDLTRILHGSDAPRGAPRTEDASKVREA